MFNLALVHIFGSLVSRTLVFLVNMTVASTFIITEAADYALITGWANALAAVIFMPMGNLYRKLVLDGIVDVTSPAFLGTLILSVLLALFLFAISPFFIVNQNLSLLTVPLTVSLSLLHFASYVAVERKQLLKYNSIIVLLYVVYFYYVKFVGLTIFEIITSYSLINLFISFFFFDFKSLNFNGAFLFIKKYRKYLTSLAVQALLGLPVLMLLQSYISNLDGGQKALVLIFIFLQIFNVINIIVQKFNQVVLPIIINKIDGRKPFYIKYCTISFLLLILLNFIFFLLKGDLYVLNISREYKIFLYFSFFYIINSISWIFIDVLNAEGHEKLVERISYFWSVFVLVIFYLLEVAGLNYILAYAVSIGGARLIQLITIYIIKRVQNESSSSSITR